MTKMRRLTVWHLLFHFICLLLELHEFCLGRNLNDVMKNQSIESWDSFSRRKSLPLLQCRSRSARPGRPLFFQHRFAKPKGSGYCGEHGLLWLNDKRIAFGWWVDFKCRHKTTLHGAPNLRNVVHMQLNGGTTWLILSLSLKVLKRHRAARVLWLVWHESRIFGLAPRISAQDLLPNLTIRPTDPGCDCPVTGFQIKV